MTREEKSFTRRNILQMAAVAGAGAVLAGCSSNAPAKAENEAVEQAETNTASAEPAADASAEPVQTDVTLTVYDPTGNIQIENLHAPRLDTLDGKTIAFISDDAWEDDRTFELIGKLMAEKYPNTTVITQENFVHGIDKLTLENNGVPEQLQEANVDAAIVGNAG